MKITSINSLVRVTHLNQGGLVRGLQSWLPQISKERQLKLESISTLLKTAFMKVSLENLVYFVGK